MNAKTHLRSGDGAVWTEGRVALGKPDLLARVDDPGLLGEAAKLLRSIAGCEGSPDVSPQDGETYEYGYWPVKFLSDRSGRLVLWEPEADGPRFVPRVDLTVTYRRDQHQTRAAYHAGFTPPRRDQLVALSPGVLDSGAVEGVRYPAPTHMSGWYMFSTDYNG